MFFFFFISYLSKEAQARPLNVWPTWACMHTYKDAFTTTSELLPLRGEPQPIRRQSVAEEEVGVVTLYVLP